MAVPFAVTLQGRPRKQSAAKSAASQRAFALVRARAFAVSLIRKRKAKKRLPVKLGRQQQPDHIRRQYAAALVALFAEAHRATQAALAAARPEIEAAARQDTRLDASAGPILAKTARAFFDAFPNTKIARVAQRYADLTSAYQKAQIVEQFKKVVGINIFGGIVEDWLPARAASFVEDNVSLIRTLAQTHFDDLQAHLGEGIAAGRRWEEIADEIAERYGVADRHAELIARDQVGKFFGALNEERQKHIGVAKYVWRTARDNRVRDAHFDREGKTFEWSDPPEDGHPGEAINCRCQAEPDLEGLLEEMDR